MKEETMYDIEHLIAYFEYQIAEKTKQLEQFEFEYTEVKKLYERSIWFRLFKTPFDQTTKGDRSWMGDWEFARYEQFIDIYVAALKRCKYHYKMGVKELGWDFANINPSKFYYWADKNNIPY